MTLDEERNQLKKANQQKITGIVTITVISIIILSILLLFGIDYNGKSNDWSIVEVKTDTTSKIGYVENSEHRNDKTRIIGTYGNPLGIFDEIIDDPTWEFKDDTTFTFTEVIKTPTRCINSVTGDDFSLLDKDYKKCMASDIEQIYKIGG